MSHRPGRLKADLYHPTTGNLLLLGGTEVTAQVFERLRQFGMSEEEVLPWLVYPEADFGAARAPIATEAALAELVRWGAAPYPLPALQDWYDLVQKAQSILGPLDPQRPHYERQLGDHEATHPLNTLLIATRIAQALGYEGQDLLDIGLGALLHDLGKLQVPAEIRLRPGALGNWETMQMRRHPMYGVDLAREWLGESLSPLVIDIIRYHHEWWNGHGYPYALHGTQVPEPAMIVSIAETYDALIADCIYRRRFSPGFAYQMVRRSAGSRYTPQVVAAFERAIWPYPPFSQVRLRNGTIAHVLDHPVPDPQRPWVRTTRGQMVLAEGEWSIADAHLPRQDLRHPLRLPVRIVLDGSELRGETMDVSTRGVRLLDTTRRIRPTSEVQIRVHANEPLQLEGRVVWVKPLEQGGVPFGVYLAPSSALSPETLKGLLGRN
ncbi:MAG TPA: HD domain-containing phosphohydrolase [Stenomitos sp.]